MATLFWLAAEGLTDVIDSILAGMFMDYDVLSNLLLDTWNPPRKLYKYAAT